ncbi:MAG: 1-deoxy-D-xylulose-5-phosphate synthase [Clostridiaceae bacterium]|jgi:1-deoxy-D-xylulose-5-phosphate synthase|nr:1-deoxy-D-xylulose-5-phosphate synthase [Clostridiaceae bacterium]
MTKKSNSENLLDNIGSPEDIRKLTLAELRTLADEIRSFLIERVSVTGGHLASNLGVVELTLALHSVFNTPRDKIVWDVGHQSYVHKILTGRKDRFGTLRQFNGLSGFPKGSESEYDSFDTGHSSTSISAALGYAKARDLLHEDYAVAAVIGDGALTGGMAFEALNDAGRSPNNMIIILNDNGMSISKNVGGFSRYLSKLRTQPIYYKAKEDFDVFLHKLPGIGKKAAKALKRAKGTIKYIVMPGMLFEEIGLKYLGPIDGHDIGELTKVLSNAKGMKGPVLIHVLTQKGKGYQFAESKPQRFHGISPFSIETGEVKNNNGPGYSDIFGKKMMELASVEPKLVAITAAMPLGTGLEKFSKMFPQRFFDVGIAEQHAVTFAAGLAKTGIVPVVAVYSTFLQRSYDQIIHDVALQNLHVIFAIDRAGLIGDDGETHQGLYDLSYLSHIPNMTILAPADYEELNRMLEYCVLQHRGPVAVRYPRGTGKEMLTQPAAVGYGKGVRLTTGSDITIVAVGKMVETALEAAELLNKKDIRAEVINARFIKPLDSKLILESASKTRAVAVIEDNCIKGGFGSSVLELLNENGLLIRTKLFGFPDTMVPHGERDILYKRYGLDAASMVREIMRLLKKRPIAGGF